MADLIRDEIDGFILKLDANNLTVISQNLNIDIKTYRHAFHRYFKTRGFIGEKGQKCKVSFISLLKQMEEGRDKGYPDKEIVHAVLRTIAPGLYLRDVLETTENLTLSRLMKFFQSHFVERNTTYLCQHLSSITLYLL